MESQITLPNIKGRGQIRKRFKVDINAYLWAKDRDDAFKMLSEHFATLAEGGETDDVFGAGSRLKVSPDNGKE